MASLVLCGVVEITSPTAASEPGEQVGNQNAWVRTVLAAALSEAEVPFHEAAQILQAATARRPRQIQPHKFSPGRIDVHPIGSGEHSPPDEVMELANASVVGYRADNKRVVGEWVAIILFTIAAALIAQQLVLQAFLIPTASMETTVNIGDRLLVNKFSYRIGDVGRGDTIVFNGVSGEVGDGIVLLKRAVALPGETIELRDDGRLWIWGPGETSNDALLLNEPYLDPQNAVLEAPLASTVPNETIWHENCLNDSSTPARCTLDTNSYFMMGDNRSRSLDSRSFGPIDQGNLIGRAFLRIWPLRAISTL